MSKIPERLSETQKDFLQKLNSLDFGPLAYKLMNPEDRPGLSLEQTADAITRYKGFLFLTHSNHGKAISPSRYVDYVWHNHILDTELYLAQTAALFGKPLHHFPFFGKRGAADERELLAAADYTRGQARGYFGWDDDDWCGTGGPKGPRPPKGLAELAGILFPSGVSPAGLAREADTFSLQVGNFRHTVEHIGGQGNQMFAMQGSRLDYLEKLLKLPIWVIVCMPAELSVIDEIVSIRKERLVEVSKALVEQRLAPQGFNREMVQLEAVVH
ncbi:glycine-rich domain-containing protein [Pseudoduganella sp. UC29_71]|uniref:glycine-rich domain-containing protein n=1 Tax=Pseudoduganella sp. UC29_71 TaxID=3350174 RepID=UPI00366D55FA